jgi:hypothetical protein
MSEVNVESLESSLGAAFGSDSAPAPKAAPQAAAQPAPLEPVEEPLELAEDPADLLAGEEPVEPVETPTEPSFEIDIDGKPEVITGSERVKELLSRGLKAGRGFEENARVREALQAHVQQAQLQQQFQQAVSGDIANFQALEQQLQAYEKLDWSAAYDSDPFNALKLKEQRDSAQRAPGGLSPELECKTAAVPSALATDRATGTGG